jgi:protein TonB
MKLLTVLILVSCAGVAISQDKASTPSPDATAQTLVEPVYRVGRTVRPPRLISSPQPDYPEQARKGHGAGPIKIVMTVGSDGKPRDVKVHLGISPELDQAAVEAVEKWRFKPGTKDGKPVAVLVETQFDFQPQ